MLCVAYLEEWAQYKVMRMSQYAASRCAQRGLRPAREREAELRSSREAQSYISKGM